MCNYEKYALRREREKRERRNEELNAVLWNGLQRKTREQSVYALYCSLTFVVGTSEAAETEKKMGKAVANA